MGKADFKKIDDRWYNDENNRTALNRFYNASDKAKTKKKKKKKNSGKSNHKHQYEKVLFYNEFHHLGLGRRCIICGRVVGNKWTLFTKTENGFSHIMTDEEVLNSEEYKDLPILEGVFI